MGAVNNVEDVQKLEDTPLEGDHGRLGTTAEELPVAFWKDWKIMGSLLAFALGYNSAYWVFVMPSNGLLVIVADLGGGSDAIWIATAGTLCQTIAIAIVGRLSDVFGRRWYFIFFNVLTLAGMLFASQAKTVRMLAGAVALTGFGSSAQLIGAIVVGELLPNKHRFLVYGIMTVLFAPVTALLPVIDTSPAIGESKSTGILTTRQGGNSSPRPELAGGRSTIYTRECRLPFENLHKRHSRRDLLKNLDYVGFTIFTGSTAALLVGLSWGGSAHPWKSAAVIAPIVLGGVGWIAFVFWELSGIPEVPLIPLAMLNNRDYFSLSIISAVDVMLAYSLNVIWPQQLSTVFGLDTTSIGWNSCTLTGGLLLGQLLAGLLVQPLGELKWQLVVSAVLMTAFAGGLAALDVTRVQGLVLTLLATTASGYLEIVTLVGSPMVINPDIMGIAIGAQSTLRGLLATVAITMYSTILSNEADKGIVKYVVPAVVEAGLPQTSVTSLLQALALGDQALLAKVPGVTQSVILVAVAATRVAYMHAFQIVYVSAIPFGT
ncbi:fungal trichothecene efflux pump [Exophiala viscosa]|uniref:fungal trichothecene efflux pump n=1 Tax=Exophiala viscosa TaxID=2486360 RepID=UPI00219C0A49|nr:fungal trichothecene efflux pump [Exophiala viscosa]